MALRYVQTNTLYLYGSGVVVGATSVTVTALKDIYTNVLTIADFGAKGYATLEPDTINEESFTFTGVTANANGSYTLTGVATALAKYPYTETSGLIRGHSGGTKAVLSDTTAFWNTFANKQNDEIITGAWTFNVAPVALGATPASTTALGNVKLSSTPYTSLGVMTVTIATPAVVSLAVHGLIAGDSVQFTTTGTLPTGISLVTNYYVMATGFTTNTFQFSLTTGGTAINTTGSQSGVHTLVRTTPFAVGNDDLRIPSQTKTDALAGGGTFGTPSSSNKFLTEDFLFAGDGSDGDIVISVNTTLIRDMFYNNLTINSSITLSPDGYRIYVKNTLTGPGTIQFNGLPGTNATNAVTGGPGAAGAGGVQSGSGRFKNVAGGNGAVGSNGSSPSISPQTVASNTTPGVTGSQGGAGGATGASASGVYVSPSGGVSSIEANWKMIKNKVINLIDIAATFSVITLSASASTGGAGGAGDDLGSTQRGKGGSGGGAGASGGFVVVIAGRVVGPITCIATGGVGGTGSNGFANPTSFYGGGGGGAGGPGGTVVLIYGGKTGTITYILTGGTGGTGGTGASAGNGSSGASGNAGVSYELKYNYLI